jgi:hypothetical protein
LAAVTNRPDDMSAPQMRIRNLEDQFVYELEAVYDM